MTFSPKVRAANVNQDDKTRATPRKSRPLRRKTSHSVIERRRREKINEGLIHLQDIVPACRQELKELLDCKVKMNKKNAKRSLIELQTEVENLSKEKSNSEMVLEKLCIISHTVDYVQELQEKLESYRKWCGGSPPRESSQPQLTRSHDGAHSKDQDLIYSTTSEEGDATKCLDCASSATIKAKRHWGSNNPLRLSKNIDKSLVADENDTNESQEVVPQQGIHKRNRLSFHEESSDVSDFELDDWHGSKKLCAAQLYTNDESKNNSHRATRNRDGAPIALGLLAQVSAATKRVELTN